MYTPNQISEMLQIPTSTIRRYSTVFVDYLSFKHKPGRKRDYTDQDVNTLARIRDLSNSGLTHAQIKERLEVVEVKEDQPGSNLLLIPSIAKELQTFRDFQQSTSQRITDLTNQNESLIQRVNDLENFVSLPWYKKITRRKKI
ncbi:helix-turn-helix domain-containing protein [archaeon]|nr:helix-turn-helix domain-containing protein [archaeon]